MKVIINGAGISGLTFADQLARAGWDVIITERSRDWRECGYMIDFFGAGFDVAGGMGLLPRLRELAYPIDGATSSTTQADPARG